MARLLIVLGYLLAVPFTLFAPGFRRLWRRREPWVFATAQAGALLLAVGFALNGSVVGALVNAGWAAGLAAAYIREGRRRSSVSG